MKGIKNGVLVRTCTLSESVLPKVRVCLFFDEWSQGIFIINWNRDSDRNL